MSTIFIRTFFDQRGKTNFYFILLASPKQTDKQKERWQGHCNSCGQLQWAAGFYCIASLP